MPLGDSQRAISPRFFHPTGVFTGLSAEDLDRSIPELFERQARRQPDRVAVELPDRTLTYREVDEASARVARAIARRRGRAPEPVALLLEPGPELVTAGLGVLRAGKILVVLDPRHPAAHNAAVIEAAEPSLVVYDDRSAGATGDGGLDGRRMHLVEASGSAAATGDLPAVRGDDLAAIVFTSGTTGRPKGVAHEHRSLVHLMRELINTIRLTPEDRIAMLQPPTAIAGFRTVFIALLSGGALCPFDVTGQGLLPLADWLRERRITYTHMVPTLFRSLAGSLRPDDRFPDLRAIRLGGESISRRDFELYRERLADRTALLITYNAAEVSTIAWLVAGDATVPQGDAMPAGFAREGTEILLLDAEGRPVAPGEAGEIALRSRFMSRGYWRQPELTAERFLPDPAGGDERIYRTGDRGRFLPDGALLHLGRGDARVKVRGFLVEPAEVEAALMAIPGIAQAAVVTRMDRGEGRLDAYVVSSERPGPGIEALRRALQARLPAHMVPSSIVALERMPLNAAGKVARQMLPEPGRSRPPLAEPFVAPRTPAEDRMAGIWTDVLGLEAVGVNDRFLDLGGSSLAAMRIGARVRSVFAVEVAVSTLLAAATVADMTLAVLGALDPMAMERLLARSEQASRG